MIQVLNFPLLLNLLNKYRWPPNLHSDFELGGNFILKVSPTRSLCWLTWKKRPKRYFKTILKTALEKEKSIKSNIINICGRNDLYNMLWAWNHFNALLKKKNKCVEPCPWDTLKSCVTVKVAVKYPITVLLSKSVLIQNAYTGWLIAQLPVISDTKSFYFRKSCHVNLCIFTQNSKCFNKGLCA